MPTESAVPTSTADEPPAELPPGEFQERIRLLNWAEAQVGAGVIRPRVGDWVLATDGCILGYSPDYDDLYHRVVTVAGLGGSRLVGFQITPTDW